MTNPIKRWLLLLAGVTATLIATVAFAEGVMETSVSVSGTSARTAGDLGPGWKAVRCDVAVFFRTGVLPTAVTTDLPIGAGSVRQVYITNSEKRLAFITSGGTGTCRIYPLNVGPNGDPPDTLAVDGAAISPESVTTSAAASTCAVTIPTSAYLCLSGNDTAVLTYNGSAITSNLDFDAANISATDVLAATVSFSGGGTPCLTRGGPAVVQTCTGDSFSMVGAELESQGAMDVWGNLENDANGANCSGNTGAVCVNDAGGLAVANAGTTTATISAAGKTTTTTFGVTATTDIGSITLSGGTGTATVRTGALCQCTNTSNQNAPKCAVSGTTLTATSAGATDVIVYFCPTPT